MTLIELEALITQGESSELELKKSTSLLTPAFESICAFLNEAGGTVCIGITNNGKIIGQCVSDSTRQEIANHINKIEPAPSIEVTYTRIDKSNHVITLSVKTGKYKPYIYDGRAFQRNQTTTTRMTQHRYEQLL